MNASLPLPLCDYSWIQAWKKACVSSDLELTQYLLSDRFQSFIDLSYKSDLALRTHCEMGHDPIVEYLLFDPDLQSRLPTPNLRTYGDYSLRFACHSGNLKLVKLLTSDPRLSPRYCHDQSPPCSPTSFSFHAFEFAERHPPILSYLIFDLPSHPFYRHHSYLELLRQHLLKSPLTDFSETRRLLCYRDEYAELQSSFLNPPLPSSSTPYTPPRL